MYRFLREYFAFSKRERRGLMVLLLLLLCIYVGKWTLPLWLKTEEIDFSVFNELQTATNKLQIESNTREQVSPIQKQALFYFDPNTLSQEDALQLGFTPKQISTIRNYVSKGGRFFDASDMEKIYGIDKTFLETLKPWVRIQIKSTEKQTSQSRFPIAKTENKFIILNANNADSIALESLKGVGPVLASRILKYRNRLGGFYAKEQLKEIYGIDSGLFALLDKHLQIDTSQVVKIDLNTANLEELKQHPYIGYKLAGLIINYRMQHGNYKTVADIKKIHVLNEEIFSKIEKYLKVSQ